MVGLEQTVYRVSEDVGVVRVCAIFYQPPAMVTCPAPFPFNVSISTRNATAGVDTAQFLILLVVFGNVFVMINNQLLLSDKAKQSKVNVFSSHGI